MLTPESAIILTDEGDGVARLTMQETEGKNTFTKAFTQGLKQRLDEIDRNPDIKVVILHGTDNIFSAGGTQDELLGILEGKIKFTDLDFLFYGLLRCPVPVIAAMNGHAMGGGLIMGLYADIIILAEERLYGANFMKYGFTPGMGATYIMKEKFGSSIATEMMFSAKAFHGGQLREKGLPCQVLPKDQVLPYALDLARDISQKPRTALIELKRSLTKKTLDILPSILADELRMHDITFSQPEIRSRILNLFGR